MKRLWIAVILGFLAWGCAPPSVYRRIERTVVGAVQSELGPADSWSARVSRDSIGSLVEGDISRLRIKGVNVRPKQNIVIDEVLIEARDLNIDVKNRTLKSARETAISARMSPESLAMMVAEMTDIREPVISFEQDLVQVTGIYDVLGVPFRIKARGRMTVEPPYILRFTSESVSAIGLTAPITISKTLDMGAIYPAIILENVTVTPEGVIAQGTIDSTALARLIEKRAEGTK